MGHGKIEPGSLHEEGEMSTEQELEALFMLLQTTESNDKEDVECMLRDLFDAMHILGDNQDLLVQVVLVQALAWEDEKKRSLAEKAHHLIVSEYGALYPQNIHWGLYSIIRVANAGFVTESYQQTCRLLSSMIYRIECLMEAIEVDSEKVRLVKQTYERVCDLVEVFAFELAQAFAQDGAPCVFVNEHILFAMDLADGFGYAWDPPTEEQRNGNSFVFGPEYADVWKVAYLKVRQQIRTGDFFIWLDVFGGESLEDLVLMMRDRLITRETMTLILQARDTDRGVDIARARAALVAWREGAYLQPFDQLIVQPTERLLHIAQVQERTTRDNTLF